VVPPLQKMISNKVFNVCTTQQNNTVYLYVTLFKSEKAVQIRNRVFDKKTHCGKPLMHMCLYMSTSYSQIVDK
ncbi:hypothetical protein NKR74_23825, partial [Bacillus sp. 3103sda1]|uniref:hypothetical protein n=1 Tax=Bacillus sp. 3103sda1 TaxID=2953808 RepID=UPI00209F924A